eukprot:gene478-405_t
MGNQSTKSGVVVWGHADYGQLGIGSTAADTGEKVFHPRIVETLRSVHVASVACGGHHSVAVTEDAQVYSWGSNRSGELGHPAGSKAAKAAGEPPQLQDLLAPKVIRSLNSKLIRSVACAEHHTAALSEMGILYTWGRGQNGRLGHNSEESEFTPRAVEALMGQHVVQVSCGDFHTACVTDGPSRAYTWGLGLSGRLGHGDEVERWEPMPITEFDPQPQQGAPRGGTKGGDEGSHGKAGGVFTTSPGKGDMGGGSDKVGSGAAGLGLGGGSEPSSLQHGRADSGEFGGVTAFRPQAIIAQICCGGQHTAAISLEEPRGHLLTWGGGAFGKLGHGNRVAYHQPNVVQSLLGKRVVGVALGAHHSACLTARGAVYTWGQAGRLGHGPAQGGAEADEALPRQVMALAGIPMVQLSCGAAHCCCVAANGDVYAWGTSRAYGHADPAAPPNQPTLIKVLSGKAIVQVSCGITHTIALSDHRRLTELVEKKQLEVAGRKNSPSNKSRNKPKSSKDPAAGTPATVASVINNKDHAAAKGAGKAGKTGPAAATVQPAGGSGSGETLLPHPSGYMSGMQGGGRAGGNLPPGGVDYTSYSEALADGEGGNDDAIRLGDIQSLMTSSAGNFQDYQQAQLLLDEYHRQQERKHGRQRPPAGMPEEQANGFAGVGLDEDGVAGAGDGLAAAAGLAGDGGSAELLDDNGNIVFQAGQERGGDDDLAPGDRGSGSGGAETGWNRNKSQPQTVACPHRERAEFLFLSKELRSYQNLSLRLTKQLQESYSKMGSLRSENSFLKSELELFHSCASKEDSSSSSADLYAKLQSHYEGRICELERRIAERDHKLNLLRMNFMGYPKKNSSSLKNSNSSSKNGGGMTKNHNMLHSGTTASSGELQRKRKKGKKRQSSSAASASASAQTRVAQANTGSGDNKSDGAVLGGAKARGNQQPPCGDGPEAGDANDSKAKNAIADGVAPVAAATGVSTVRAAAGDDGAAPLGADELPGSGDNFFIGTQVAAPANAGTDSMDLFFQAPASTKSAAQALQAPASTTGDVDNLDNFFFADTKRDQNLES